MTTFLYTWPSDNIGTTATISVNTGTEDTAYPKANLVSGEPQKPAKLTTTTGSWVLDMGSAKRVDIVSLIHHNLDAGLDVRIQGHTANSWATPDVTATFTIPAAYIDKFPSNCWVDIKTLYPVDANRTKRYWRLLINAANSAAVSVGELVIAGTKRDFGIRNIKVGSTRTWMRPAKIHETDGLVRKRYDIGTTVRKVDLQIEPTKATLSDVESLFRDAQGAVKAFLIVPHSEENDAWYVTLLTPDQAYIRTGIRDYNTATLSFGELSRGLFP